MNYWEINPGEEVDAAYLYVLNPRTLKAYDFDLQGKVEYVAFGVMDEYMVIDQRCLIASESRGCGTDSQFLIFLRKKKLWIPKSRARPVS